MRRFGGLALLLLVAACGTADSPTPAPTFGPILGASEQTSTQSPSGNVVVLPRATPNAQATPDSGADAATRHREWMQAARSTHPYSDTVDVMWQVMLCESSGNPDAIGPGELQGLFQYQPSTWAQTWNPYRDQPVSDPRAQIFATAKAWSDGNQHWWDVCLP